jgi:hypothetical protein
MGFVPPPGPTGDPDADYRALYQYRQRYRRFRVFGYTALLFCGSMLFWFILIAGIRRLFGV